MGTDGEGRRNGAGLGDGVIAVVVGLLTAATDGAALKAADGVADSVAVRGRFTCEAGPGIPGTCGMARPPCTMVMTPPPYDMLEAEDVVVDDVEVGAPCCGVSGGEGGCGAAGGGGVDAAGSVSGLNAVMLVSGFSRDPSASGCGTSPIM